MKLIQCTFSKILPNFDFEVNFILQLYISLNCKDPVHLQITFRYAY